MPLRAPCLTSLVPIVDPVSALGLLSLESLLTCAVEIPACHPLRFPLWVSSSPQDKSSDSWKLCGVLPE
ncbi:hypothetical protein CHARACLAT_020202 [Characodon lateralis]|uniref:Secreted protein n=1 Tax=Characodon lateralis TaxID=208331 RepID=A0ABU7DTB6_9TELE|nr:hypothetical protein [Characodon lateralis]